MRITKSRLWLLLHALYACCLLQKKTLHYASICTNRFFLLISLDHIFSIILRLKISRDSCHLHELNRLFLFSFWFPFLSHSLTVSLSELWGLYYGDQWSLYPRAVNMIIKRKFIERWASNRWNFLLVDLIHDTFIECNISNLYCSHFRIILFFN